MLLSEKYNCIFLKTPCTGSTTVEDVLISYIKSHNIDILSQDHNRCKSIVSSKYEQFNDISQHVALHGVQVGITNFDDYRVIVSIRNPWERAVSLYYLYKNRKCENNTGIQRQLIEKANILDFNEWIKCVAKIMPDLLQQRQYYRSIHDVYYIDNVIRYENLIDDIKFVVSSILDISESEIVNIPQSARHRPEKPDHYSLSYTQYTNDLISELCQEDIDTFNYQFWRPLQLAASS